MDGLSSHGFGGFHPFQKKSAQCDSRPATGYTNERGDIHHDILAAEITPEREMLKYQLRSIWGFIQHTMSGK